MTLRAQLRLSLPVHRPQTRTQKSPTTYWTTPSPTQSRPTCSTSTHTRGKSGSRTPSDPWMPCNWGHSEGKDGEKEDPGRPRGGGLEMPTSPPTPSTHPTPLHPPRWSREGRPLPAPGPRGPLPPPAAGARAKWARPPRAGGSGVGCSWQCGWRARAAGGADY